MVSPVLKSGCPDLNWGPLRPERSALPGCATPRAQTGYRSDSASERAGVDDLGAGVLDIVDARGLGDLASLGRDDAELEPDRLRAGGDGGPRDLGAELGTAEDVDEVDRLLDVEQRAGAADAVHLLA